MLISCFLAGLCLLAAPPADGDSPFRITPDRATIQVEEGGKSLVVSSPGGIGKATLDRISPAWPGILTLRIGIKGLEGFVCRNERLEVRGALGRNEVEVRTRASEKAEWSPAKISREPALVVRRKGETIEVQIPRELLTAEAKYLHVEWIDFYRG